MYAVVPSLCTATKVVRKRNVQGSLGGTVSVSTRGINVSVKRVNRSSVTSTVFQIMISDIAHRSRLQQCNWHFCVWATWIWYGDVTFSVTNLCSFFTFAKFLSVVPTCHPCRLSNIYTKGMGCCVFSRRRVLCQKFSQIVVCRVCRSGQLRLRGAFDHHPNSSDWVFSLILGIVCEYQVCRVRDITLYSPMCPHTTVSHRHCTCHIYRHYSGLF